MGGNRILTFRFPPELVAEMEAAIHASNAVRKGEPHTWSSWVREAIENKINHAKRGRVASKRRTLARQLNRMGVEP